MQRGERIGRYEILRTVGKGGMGEAYLALDPHLERQVVVKMLSQHRYREHKPETLERFSREAKIIAQLDNPHIVKVFDYDPGGENTPPFIVMEYVSGQNLATILETRAPLPYALVMRWAAQALRGLCVAHRAGVIHRDIKPSNIMLTDDGVIKLLDFGLARSLFMSDDLTSDSSCVGTLYYLSPEVAQGERATAQSDLYSLGMSAYELLSGRHPFTEDSPARLISRIVSETPPPVRASIATVPAAVDMWLQRMLAKSPAERFPSSDDALAALLPLLDALPQEESDAFFGETEDLTSVTAAVRPAVPPQEPAQERADQSVCLKQEDLSGIISRAIRLEEERRGELNRDAIAEIAEGVGVSPDVIDSAIRDYKADITQKKKRTRWIRIGGAVAAGILLVWLLIAFLLRSAPQEGFRYVTTGNQSGTLVDNQPLDVKAAAVPVGTKWTPLGLTYNAGSHVLAIRAIPGRPLACRIGTGPEFHLEKDGYLHREETGEVSVKSPRGATSVSCAVVEKLRIAVLPFREMRANGAVVAEGIADVISTRLAQTKCFDLLERVHINRLIENVKLENTVYFDTKTSSRIGKMVGTGYVIEGTIQRSGNMIRMTARRTESQTGKILEPVIVDGKAYDFFTLQDRLAEKLMAAIAQTECNRFLAHHRIFNNRASALVFNSFTPIERCVSDGNAVKTALYSTDFTTIDSTWTKHGDPAYGTITTASDGVTFVCNASCNTFTFWDINDVPRLDRAEPAGNFDVVLHCPETNADEYREGWGVSHFLDENNEVRAGTWYNDRLLVNGVYDGYTRRNMFHAVTDGIWDWSHEYSIPTSQVGYVRLQKIGNVYSAFWKVNASDAWAQIGPSETWAPETGTKKMTIFADTWNNSGNHTARFASFEALDGIWFKNAVASTGTMDAGVDKYFDWSSLTASITTGATVSYEVRESEDATTWSAWQSGIPSSNSGKRYAEMRITFGASNESEVTLESISINSV